MRFMPRGGKVADEDAALDVDIGSQKAQTPPFGW